MSALGPRTGSGLFSENRDLSTTFNYPTCLNHDFADYLISLIGQL